MNWQNIIENGLLIYQSKENDIPFRNWSLKKTRCKVVYYETHPLDDIDKVVCSLLSDNNDSMEEYEIATILGFNVQDNFEVQPKRYADVAELQLFRAIIKPLYDWGLVKRDESNRGIISLTDLGKRSWERKEKYCFYSAEKLLFENYGINAIAKEDSVFFPFYEELNIDSNITTPTKLKYDDVDISIFDKEETDLIKRLHLQSSTKLNIYNAVETNYFDIESEKVDFSIYKYNDKYYPIVFVNDKVRPIATTLINNAENSCLKEKKIEWGLYLRLMNDENAILDYEAISPFEDIIDTNNLILDKRTVWQDNTLFSFILQNANANQMSSISTHCPIDVIKRHIEDKSIEWNWIILSQRIDEQFIIDNPLLRWDFEVISSRSDITINAIKSLLLIPELNKVEWDWDAIMPRLDYDFIKNNIQSIDFDLYELTRNENKELRQLISQNPDKKWDWIYISDEYDLDYILDNITNFTIQIGDGKQRSYLNLRKIIERAFSSQDYAEQYYSSHPFKMVLTENTTFLSNFTLNTSELIWSPNLILFLEDVGLLTWSSGFLTKGFECNPYVKWDKEYFNRFSSKISTEQGFAFVSSRIEDTNIILENTNFNWDWEAISNNPSLISDDKFIKRVISSLSLSQVIPQIREELIEELFLNYNLIELLNLDNDLWSLVTQKVSIEFVRNHIDYNWNWVVLTHRFYKTIKINALGNEKWINKWDWTFLTQNLDLDLVTENLELYYERWDWEYLTEHLSNDFIINHLREYIRFWDWNSLLEAKLDKSDLTLPTLNSIAICISALDDEKQVKLWDIITRKFECDELIKIIHVINIDCQNSILFKWNYEYLYSQPNFDIYQYLDDYCSDIKWDIISRSSSLNHVLKRDNVYSEKRWLENTRQLLCNEEYKWEFSELSKIENINSQIDILSIRTAEWDWEYLTANSRIFDTGKDFIKNFYKFRKNLSFEILSMRQETGVTPKLISKNINCSWNWEALSQNTSIKFTIDFILENESKPWNWEFLSIRGDEVKLDNKSLFELRDKNWNWQLLSNCQSIEFNEDLISKLYEKSFDWRSVSRNTSFVPNQNTLSLLKGKDLDWNAISDNPRLDESILWDYRELLNWKSITKNKIDFSDINLLDKYIDYIDWEYISSKTEFNISIENLYKFKNKLNWQKIQQRTDFVITNEILEYFADVINWDKASQSRDITFSEELIETYKSKWNWKLLRQNPSVIDKLDYVLKKYVSAINCVEFIDRFHRTPYIYHFTHLFNAVDIIKNRKILSRNRAEGHFSNAAGILVDRRNTAHNYARFYYRPQTPTQFYNECLGWDNLLQTSWGKSYYSQASSLGLPKCPMPVFFKFDLEEVVSKMPDICYYSTGNMQTNWASVKKISEEPFGLETNKVYSTIQDGIEIYKQYSQQEFLVLDEFDFSKLESFEIICYDDEQAEILKQQLENDDVVSKITTKGNGVYHRNNRELTIRDQGETLSISSNYNGDAYFRVLVYDKHIINTTETNILRETKDCIFAYPNVSFSKTDSPIEVHFIDERNRDWVIYRNARQNTNIVPPIDYYSKKYRELSTLFDTRVRHYTIRQHTEIVCSVFEKYFTTINIPIDKTLFKIFLSLHDIGKPIAEQKGDRSQQHKYTTEIINKYDLDYGCFKVDDASKKILGMMANNDCLGEYFQDLRTINNTYETLLVMAKEINLRIEQVFYLFMVYYLCDVAAYTKDEGGYPFLEKLFEYSNGHKIFDHTEKLIKMSNKYWEKYKELKTYIYDSKY